MLKSKKIINNKTVVNITDSDRILICEYIHKPLLKIFEKDKLNKFQHYFLINVIELSILKYGEKKSYFGKITINYYIRRYIFLEWYIRNLNIFSILFGTTNLSEIKNSINQYSKYNGDIETVYKFYAKKIYTLKDYQFDSETYNEIKKEVDHKNTKREISTNTDRKCKKCGSSKIITSFKQYRSSDEEATLVIVCSECGYRQHE